LSGRFTLDTQCVFLYSILNKGSSIKQVILFVAGIGAPQGLPFVPVIKVTANPLTYERLSEHMDIDIVNSHKESGRAIFEETLSVASGKKTISLMFCCHRMLRAGKGEETSDEVFRVPEKQ